MEGVGHNAGGLADAAGGVNVHDGRRETPMIFSAVRCRVSLSEAVQFPNQAMMQLLKMLSTVPL